MLEHWEQYYRGGALATCPTGPGGGYDLEVRDGWVRLFSDLPDGACVLDVGTGNGAVALIALETAASLGRHYEIDAVDLARIDPPRDVPDGERIFRGIRFHAQVATERLPFEAGCIDVVTGQYALEYMEPGAALAEIRRVLKPGARARFVLHHAESVILRNARWSLRQGEMVLNETKVYRRLRRLLAAEQKSAQAARTAGHDLRMAIAALQRELQVAARSAGSGLVLSVTLDAVQKLLTARTRVRPAALERDIDRAESELRASMRRLKDLVGVALTEQGLSSIEAAGRAAGLHTLVRGVQVHGGDNVVGWELVLQRR